MESHRTDVISKFVYGRDIPLILLMHALPSTRQL